MDSTPTYNTLANRRLRSLDRDYIEGLFNIRLLDAVNEKIPQKFPNIRETQCHCKKMVDDITNYKIISNPPESQCVQCAICRNQLVEPCNTCENACLVIGSKICIHEFHYHCIKNWLTMHDVCPLCNREWLITNEAKITVNFANGYANFGTENKNKTEFVAEIYKYFNTDVTKYVLTKNGAVVDIDTADLKYGNYALCTPDVHSGANCIELRLQKGATIQKIYAKPNMLVSDLKREIATHFNIFREEIAIYHADFEITSHFDNCNVYNIGLDNESEILVSDDNPVDYCIAITNDHAVIYANCGATQMPQESNFQNNLRALLTGRKSWNPYPYILNVNLVDISNLLAALYVLVSRANKKDTIINDIIKRFEKYLQIYKMPVFPKSSLALLLNLDMINFSDMHRTIIAVSFHELINAMRIMCPNAKVVTSPLMNSNLLCDLLLSSEEPSIINWEFAIKKMRLNKTFNILSPIAINNLQPPILTMNENNQIVVFMGKGKNAAGAALIYNPLSNSESEVNLAELGKKLSDSNIFMEDDRVFQEAIMVCIDTSNSMSSGSDFREDVIAKQEAKNKKIKQYYAVWDEITPVRPPYEFTIHDNRKLKNAIVWFVTHGCFVDWQRDKNCLREIVVVENSEYPEIAAYLSKFRNIFSHILKHDCFRIFGNNYKCSHKSKKNKKLDMSDNTLVIRLDDGTFIKYPVKIGDNLYDVIYYLHKYYGYNAGKYVLKSTKSVFSGISPETPLVQLSNEIHLCWNSQRTININIYAGMNKFDKRTLTVPTGTRVKDIIYKYNRYHYDQCIVYTDAEETGDGYFSGHKLRYETRINDDTDLYFFNLPYAEYQPGTSTCLSRLDIVKKLFDAFVDRSIAYAFNTAIGLMSFDDKSRSICDITAYYESFREKVDSLETNGNTALYDCILDAASRLTAWKTADPEHRSQAKLRIVCLSDGADTNSIMKNINFISKSLNQKSIILDAILIGKDYDKKLIQICSENNGYIFNPTTIKCAIDIMELETMIISAHRANTRKYEILDEGLAPPIQEPGQQLLAKSMSSKVIDNIAFDTKSKYAAIIREYRNIMEKPHPDIDVYINENDATFWKVVFTGPDATPYAGGCWLAYMKFPDNYPLSPPEMRMTTPIKHCNINNYGRICHSIFDRNYVPSVKVSLILECVYGLLLNPDISDPLDTNLAMLFYDASGQYEAAIMEHVKKYAHCNRQHWRRLLIA